MTEKMLYTQFLQANIRRYAWQSFIIKITAVLVAMTFLVIAVHAPASMTFASGASLWLACAVAIAFLLWCGDGYSADMMERYSNMYEAADKETNPGNMKLEQKGLSISAVWRPTLLAFHVPMMVMLILLTMAVR